MKPTRYQMPPGVTELVKELGEFRLPGGDRDVEIMTGGREVTNEREYGCFVGNDGNMWTWDVPDGGTTVWPQKRLWLNDGRPPNAEIDKAMGTLVVDGSRPYIFVSGTDGCLWTRYWDGAAMQWGNLGRPGAYSPNRALGNLLADGARPLIFMTATDGNMWLCQWAGEAWQWTNLANPGCAVDWTVAKAFVNGDHPYVWVMAGGIIWCCWWDGSSWQWANHGLPEEGAVITGGSINHVDDRHGFVSVYVATTNGAWLLEWRGDWGRWYWKRPD